MTNCVQSMLLSYKNEYINTFEGKSFSSEKAV